MDDKSYEPMDVDLSSHSNAMDISYTGTNIDLTIIKTEPEESEFLTKSTFDFKPPNNINKLIICSVQNSNASTSRTNANLQPFIFLSLTILIMSIFAFHLANFKCCENFNLEILRNKLMTRLYGQSVAVENIVKALDAKENRKILLFQGGTGVGKTLTASIILENLLDHNNIYHYTMPSFLEIFSSEFMLGLLFCKSVIVVVDDLNRNDVSNIKGHIKDMITKSETLSKNLIIILIYNCDVVNDDFFRKCDESFSSELKQNMEDLDAHKYFIKFKTLTEKHLKNCIEDELLDRKSNVKDINQIVKMFNVTLDGCKGVYQKLQYLKIL